MSKPTYTIPCGQENVGEVYDYCRPEALCPTCEIMKELVEACQLGKKWAEQSAHWRGSNVAPGHLKSIEAALACVRMKEIT